VYFLSGTENALDFDMKWGREPSRTYIRTFTHHVVTKRAALLEEWEQEVCR